MLLRRGENGEPFPVSCETWQEVEVEERSFAALSMADEGGR